MATSQTRNGEQLSDDLDALKADLASLRASMGELVGSLVDEGKARASNAGDAVAKKAKATIAGAEDSIRERPLLAVLIALVIGLILGRVVLK